MLEKNHTLLQHGGPAFTTSPGSAEPSTLCTTLLSFLTQFSLKKRKLPQLSILKLLYGFPISSPLPVSPITVEKPSLLYGRWISPLFLHSTFISSTPAPQEQLHGFAPFYPFLSVFKHISISFHLIKFPYSLKHLLALLTSQVSRRVVYTCCPYSPQHLLFNSFQLDFCSLRRKGTL